ncbi:MAG: DnaJ domain-containing protein, partial [Cyanobacteria bacterium]|nr:DnaJ domain-containing protein [Cyanobacteriota bacterium]
MPPIKDYYLVLEVESFSELDVVKAAFRRLARRYHPDLNADNPLAEDKFKQINEAYEVLGDVEKKQKYDEMMRIVLNRPIPKPPPAKPPVTKPANPQGASSKSVNKPGQASQKSQGPKTSTPISEIFQTFRNNVQGGGNPYKGQENKSSESSSKSSNPKSTSSSSSSTSNTSSTTSSSSSEHKPPPTPSSSTKSSSGSSGPDPKKVFRNDQKCRGEDVNVEAQITSLESEQGVVKTVNVQHHETCRRCAGSGRVNGVVCNGCHGEKSTIRLKKIDVRIPPGVKQGSRVRIAREGGKGVNGGDNGDLYLLIRITMDTSLRIDGVNVYCDLPL